MSSISDYLEDELLKHELGESTYTAPGTFYVALFTSNPTDADSGTEVSGGSYARQTVTWNTVLTAAATNDGDIQFPTATANWGTITHIAIYDALTTGNLLRHAELSESITINSGSSYKIADENLTVTLD